MADRLIAKITLSDEQMEEIRDIKRQMEKLKRKKGEWIKDEGSVPLCFECSVCGWIISAGFEEENNYCPHCGADMRGEDE